MDAFALYYKNKERAFSAYEAQKKITEENHKALIEGARHLTDICEGNMRRLHQLALTCSFIKERESMEETHV